ncbi:MAG: sodium:proton antiporter, partial [Lacipirellulaceae bacterium]
MSRTGERRGGVVVWAIFGLLTAYCALLVAELPQSWTAEVVGAHAEHSDVDIHPEPHDAGHHKAEAPPYWTVIPFVILLGCIAVLPLLHKTEHWWEENINRFKVAAGLGIVTLCYYAFLHHTPVEGHWPSHHVVE